MLISQKYTGTHISTLCKRLRIPVNVTDAPNLCTFTLLSTHSDGPLQIGITTSGNGCKLASRIRREIAASLPPKLGEAVQCLGTIRQRIWEEDNNHQIEDASASASASPLNNDDSDPPAQTSTFNQLIRETDPDSAKTRRIRWLSQICEYWPLSRLASVTESDITTILQSYTTSSSDHPPLSPRRPIPRPQILLAGSGPGSPSLLTLATHQALHTATLILADKLVPAAVLDLIPRRTPVHIARKFPGNADAAQAELLALGLDALQRGHTVLRLKQGDPYIYGRGAEEFAFFHDRGFTPIVLPGITSALSAPLFAAIPPTHRSVADQVLICTGTGRKGVAPTPPPYIPTQTVIFLMSLHRLPSLVSSLINPPPLIPTTPTDPSSSTQPLSISPSTSTSISARWPPSTPCAVIERASCPDQRVLRSTLEHICVAVEEQGSRPPGLLVMGHSCEVLQGRDGEQNWIVEEGFKGLEGLEGLGGGGFSSGVGKT